MKRFILFLLAICALTSYTHAQVGVMRTSSVYAVQKVNPYDLGPLTRNGNIYYYHGKPMKQAEMIQFLNQNCAEAYNYYLKQHKIEMAGWALFGVGAGMAIGGGIMNYFVHYGNRNGNITTEAYKRLNPISFAISGIGGAMFVSSIPMICVGAVRKKNVHRVYNQWCGYKELENTSPETSQLELKLTSGANGFGLALSF